ncbi:YoaK family protein [Variovorax sp. LjRoot178]|uniref:YoaK family protein n=1 Tax=Variovorax sp. LjRoot178 TaxID=3342277 RepID=UPI003ECF4463
MPINYARRLTGRKRTANANRHLGFALAFVAGAINAGGFLAVQQYTSHMTGIVSSMADNLVLGVYDVVLSGAGGLLSFLAGAASSAVLVNYARRRRMHSEYALPLLTEASLLICFGVLGARLSDMRGLFVPVTVMLLCFIMGLQNAVITKLSHAEIRTTHLTGIVTDIGIEFGKLFYRNAAGPPSHLRVMANRDRLRVLTLLVVFFFAGGVLGAIGFKYVGYVSTVPLALVLLGLAMVPAADDLTTLARRWGRAARQSRKGG